ncbi:MAG: DotA/TraY family protein [Alphaproteobacteria bacterium]|nr:DotA/TraY family protein [Alphaproteobacteria bacterium]
MQNIKAKDVIAYAIMPRIIPRIKEFFASGFGYVSFLMAQVFAVVRLLPASHPYLNSKNIGRYGLRHVIAQAAENLTFSYKNIDQIIVFFSMLIGIAILIIQFVLLAYTIFISPVMATASIFDTAHPQTDIAFNLLDEVFGIPGLFCSTSNTTLCSEYATKYLGVSSGVGGKPLPFHSALHGLFEFYTTGLMMIAMLLFLYFVVVVVVETAVTGTPFGQRFKNFWVPIRLIVAIGLLMPVNYGLSSGQYIVLYTAKYASGLATNGWNAFNEGVAAHALFNSSNYSNGLPIGEQHSLLALPEAPDISALVESMSIVHACAYAYHRLNGGFNSGNKNETKGSGDYPNRRENYVRSGAPLGEFEVQAFFVKTKTAGMVNGKLGTSDIDGTDSMRQYISDRTSVPYFAKGASPVDALGFYYGGDIIIRFGEFRMLNNFESNPIHKQDTGYVKPLCGDVRIPISNLTDPAGTIASASTGGAGQIQKFYYDLILELWFEAPELRQVGRTLIETAVEQNDVLVHTFCDATEGSAFGPIAAIDIGSGPQGFLTKSECKESKKTPASKWRSMFISDIQTRVKRELRDAWANYLVNTSFLEFEDKVKKRGWGGTGIWYNKIAEINGGWIDAVNGIPRLERFPAVMEEVKEYKQQHVQNLNPKDIYTPTVAASSENAMPKQIKLKGDSNSLTKIALPLSKVYSFWNPPNDNRNNDKLNEAKDGNPFMSAINMLLGTSGLFEIRKANQHIHPMAQLSAIGKGLVNSAVLNMAVSTTSAALGGILKSFEKMAPMAGLVDAVSKLFYSTAFIGLTAGFVLFYVLPFMPFLYFFFAVANWVKTIFEAMLGVPLWALAHMRIDGEGLPGEAAANGYFLILEILIRPIMTVIAFLAAIIIFSTQVRILNLVWDVVVANAAGFTEVDNIINGSVGSDIMFFRNEIDQFFFTIVYTIVVYMLGMSSFKLIDIIPDKILRWTGSGASAYGDIDQDNVESLSRYAAVGGMTIGNQAAGALVSLGQGLGGSLGSTLAGPKSSPSTAKKE